MVVIRCVRWPWEKRGISETLIAVAHETRNHPCNWQQGSSGGLTGRGQSDRKSQNWQRLFQISRAILRAD